MSDPFSPFEKWLASVMNIAFGFMKRRGYTEHNCKIINLEAGKYVRSGNPVNELLPIISMNDLSQDTAIFLSFQIECDDNTHSFFGSFYIDETNTLQTIYSDQDEATIRPEDIDESEEKLTERVIRRLETYRGEIWDLVILALNLIINSYRPD